MRDLCDERRRPGGSGETGKGWAGRGQEGGGRGGTFLILQFVSIPPLSNKVS